MVRKDMVNNMVGYRTASIGDAWMGPSRFSPEMRKAVVDVATLIMGRNTFKVLVTAEKSWKAGISVAKQTIVIRSVIVPMANLASNVLQAATNGVPVRSIAKGFATKLIEIDHHLKNLDRLVEINALLARYRDDVFETRKLLAEKKSLEDASRRMSIWPLIEAGEFATISEGLTEADAAIAQGKWVDYIHNLVEKVPAKFGTVGDTVS